MARSRPRGFIAALGGLLALLIIAACGAPTPPPTSPPAPTFSPAPQAPPAASPLASPVARAAPQFNPFANLTSQQAECLRSAWGAQAFQDITTFVRPPTRQEEQPIPGCGLPWPPQPATGAPGGQQPTAPPSGGQPPTAQPPSSGQSSPDAQQPAGEPSVLRDQVYFTTSADGLTWAAGTLLSDKASVPDVIRTSQGSIWAYWVDFSQWSGKDTEKVSVARSADGTTWEKLGTVRFSGLGSIVPVDPDVVELPDGRLRMYFYDITQGQGDHPIYSALSADGLNFTLESGVRFKAEKIYDPDVVRLKDGRYRMYLNSSDILSATSADGLAFTQDSGVRVERGAVPGSILLADGSVRLYVCQMGIAAYKSSDGLSFTLEKNGVIRHEPGGKAGSALCDPSVTALPGGYLMVYKYNPGQ